MQRDSWPLLALLHSDERRLSPVQVQKTLFLVGEYVASADPDFYEFQPYHYGPFDQQVYEDLDSLARAGLVRKVQSSSFSGFEFELTPHGQQFAQTESLRLDDRQRLYLKRVVPWVRSLSFRQLVTAIYSAFPDMAKNSVFKY